VPSAAVARTRGATLMEIARAARVSVATVSNVVNGKFDMMGVETRDHVLRIIEQMNYRPHAIARKLRLARQLSIGVVIVDPSPAFLADAFNTYLVAGLSNYLSRRGYGLYVLGSTADLVRGSFLVRNQETDALCVIPSGPYEEQQAVFETLRNAGQPLVVFQETAPEWLDDTMSIRQDDRAGARMLGERLLARGARRLLMLNEVRVWPALERREQGFRDAIEASGVEAELAVVRCRTTTMHDTQAALAYHAERHKLPDAVLGGNDQMGIAALQWAHGQGLRVPDDVRITGFNAFDFWAYSRPALTTVRSPAYEMGELGGECLLERLDAGVFTAREIVMPVELQIGGSD
jgi:LacI family transcriptional regulator